MTTIDTQEWDETEEEFSEYREQTTTTTYFTGDEGRLELAQRKVLVVLLKNRFITARSHPREYAALVHHPAPIRSRLNDVFLELVLDTEREVAYKRPVTPDAGGPPFPTLLHDTAWGREETLLMVFLRDKLRAQQADLAKRVFVDRDEIHERVEAKRPASATNLRDDRRKVTRAIDSVQRAGLLIGPATGDRFEISPAIEVMLPVAKLRELHAWLAQQNSGDAPPPETGDLTDGRD